MTNREAFEAAMTKLAEQPEEAFEKPYPDDDVNAHWAVWQAAEASAIERCAVAAWSAGMDEYGSFSQLMDPRHVGSICAKAIRALAKESV